jgi:hypothetical protein
MKAFSAETLLALLIKKYEYLNDDNATAQRVYELIMASKPNTK